MEISFNAARLTVDGTDLCVGRDCAMCSGNPSPFRTQAFTVEQARDITGEIVKMGLGLSVTLTGGGETLLTPDLPEIMEEFLGYPKTSSVSVITSGFLPEEEYERENLEKIIRSKSVGRIEICLSFHVFGKRFRERFKNTLRFLMRRPQVRRVDVKMTYNSETIGPTILQFQNVLQELAWEESPLSTVNEYGIDFLAGGVKQFIGSSSLKGLVSDYSEENAYKIMAGLLTVPFKYVFRRECARKEPLEVWLYPQEVSLFGKGAKIKTKRRTHPYQCATLFGGSPPFADNVASVHVGSDGFYYPSCGCPYDEKLRLGKAGSDSVMDALKRLARFEYLAAKEMRPRKLEFYEKIPCMECIRLCGAGP